MDSDQLLVGSIAPDLAKLLGKTKNESHFLFGDKGIPHIDKFLEKYSIEKPFEMGYYIHLYTDLFWFKELIPKHFKNKQLYLRNGEKLDIPFEERLKLIYKDYSSLNELLLKKYDLDISFLKKRINIDTRINELDFNQINLLLNETNKLITTSVTYPLEIFEEQEIIDFINKCTNYILKEVDNELYKTSK